MSFGDSWGNLCATFITLEIKSCFRWIKPMLKCVNWVYYIQYILFPLLYIYKMMAFIYIYVYIYMYIYIYIYNLYIYIYICINCIYIYINKNLLLMTLVWFYEIYIMIDLILFFRGHSLDKPIWSLQAGRFHICNRQKGMISCSCWLSTVLPLLFYSTFAYFCGDILSSAC